MTGACGNLTIESVECQLRQNFQEALQGAAKVAEDFRAEQDGVKPG